MIHLIAIFIFNFKDSSGNFALHKAATRGHEAIVELLVNSGVNVNVVNLGQEAPLQNAAGKGSEKIVEFLIKNGAEVFYERN